MASVGTYKDAGLSSEQKARVSEYKRQWNNAASGYEQAKAAGDTAGMEKYQQLMDESHAGAEAVRAEQGYSGGSDGTEYIKLSQQTVQQPVQQTVQTVSSGYITAPAVTPTNDYSQYIETLNEAAKQKSLSALKTAYDKNVNAIDAAAEQISPQYEDARNQAAGQAALNQRNWQEMASAAGLNSGAAGQAALSQNVALQNNLNSLRKAESADLATLEAQRAQTESDYNNAIAKAEADGDYELAQQLYEEKVRVDESARSDMLTAFQLQLQALQQNQTLDQNALAQQNWEQNREDTLLLNNQKLESEEKALAQKQVNQLIKVGVMPSDELLSSSGYTKEYVQGLLGLTNGQATVEAGQPTTGGRTYNNGGLTDEQVKLLQRVYGVAEDGKWGSLSTSASGGLTADEAWARLQSGGLDSSLSPAAQSIANAIRHINPGTAANVPQTFAQRIGDALDSGTISGTEADYLLTLLGA